MILRLRGDKFLRPSCSEFHISAVSACSASGTPAVRSEGSCEKIRTGIAGNGPVCSVSAAEVVKSPASRRAVASPGGKQSSSAGDQGADAPQPPTPHLLLRRVTPKVASQRSQKSWR